MKVAIINLTAGGMSGGYRKYLENVLPRMARHPEVESIICATPSRVNIESSLGEVPNTTFTSCKPLSIFNSQQDPELEKKLEAFSPDVVYVPIERWFRLKNVPVVITIQNMEPFEYPYENNPIGEKIKNYFRIRYAREAIDKSDRVIAISRSVRDFLVNKCATPAGKIGVVYHGAEPPGENAAAIPVPVPENIRGNFLFTAGSIRPARGLEDIVHAMGSVKRAKGEAPGLVIAGSPDRSMDGYKNMLLNLIGRYSLSSRVFWAGHLDRREMSWCYGNCAAFIMSSRVESFGQTAVEAMSHGCLCFSADNSCLPEIFGDAAVYYKAKNGESLAGVLSEYLTARNAGPPDIKIEQKSMKNGRQYNSNEQKSINDVRKHNNDEQKSMKKGLKYNKNELKTNALRRAAFFSWDICAAKTVEELKKATGKFTPLRGDK